MSDIIRTTTTPDQVLIAIQNKLMAQWNVSNSVVYITLEPIMLLIVTKVPWYITIYHKGMKLRNDETINPLQFPGQNPSTLVSNATTTMQVMITLWVNHGSDTAQRNNYQLTDSTTLANGLWTQITNIQTAMSWFDPQDGDGNFILSRPFKLINIEPTTRMKSATTSGATTTYTPFWSSTNINYECDILYESITQDT